MRILFVCSRNRLRSPTAEAVFAQYEGLEAASAGTAADAETPISSDLIEWADLIFAMESHHRKKLLDRFGKFLGAKRVVVLRIQDKYGYMDAELIEILDMRVSGYLPQAT